MKALYIVNKPWTQIRFGIGIIFIITGILILISDTFNSRFFTYLFTFVNFIAGAAYMTNDFGLSKTYLLPENNKLVIKLMSKLKPVVLEDSEIEKIIMKRFEIEVVLKNGKPVKLNLVAASRDEKNNIYHFFIDYSKERRIILERLTGN